MIKNEPSDRQDRRIQRRKMRAMWRSIREEKARLAALPGRNQKTVHYIDRDGEDATEELYSVMAMILATMILVGVIIVLTV